MINPDFELNKFSNNLTTIIYLDHIFVDTINEQLTSFVAGSLTEKSWEDKYKKSIVQEIYGKYGITDIEKAKQEYGYAPTYVYKNNIYDLHSNIDIKNVFIELFSRPIINATMADHKEFDFKKPVELDSLLLIRHNSNSNLWEHSPFINKKCVFLYFINANDNEVFFTDLNYIREVKANQLCLIPHNQVNDFLIRQRDENKDYLYYIKGVLK